MLVFAGIASVEFQFLLELECDQEIENPVLAGTRLASKNSGSISPESGYAVTNSGSD